MANCTDHGSKLNLIHVYQKFYIAITWFKNIENIIFLCPLGILAIAEKLNEFNQYCNPG